MKILWVEPEVINAVILGRLHLQAKSAGVFIIAAIEALQEKHGQKWYKPKRSPK